jgi:serine/threonine-protein kinase RsbW
MVGESPRDAEDTSPTALARARFATPPSAYTGGDVSDATGTSMPLDGEPEPADGSPVSGPEVRLRLPAVPENVGLVRQALAGLAEQLGVDAMRLSDMKIALTEACTNAVVHAYGERAGPLEATMAIEHRRLVLTVRDHGRGLHPLPATNDGPPLGFGLALIASLADEFGIAGGRRGTAVRIAFALDGSEAPPLLVQLAPDERWPEADVALVLRPGARAAAVLGRVVALVAARADFSIDRVSDAQIVSDTIAGAAGRHLLDGTLGVAIDERAGGFDLLVGPLVPGGGEQLVRDTDLPGLGCLLERLTDALEIEPLAGAAAGERLRASLLART